ncbi:ABC transporter ATP-binding protein [Bordetella pertussis]|nr:ABC transporter ATP-binding protein [Bordetella pertussis]
MDEGARDVSRFVEDLASVPATAGLVLAESDSADGQGDAADAASDGAGQAHERDAA